MQLDRKVALVTGSAKGIGEGIAERFLEAGAAVALVDLDADRLHQTAERLKAKGKLFALAGDVANEDDVRVAIAATVEHLGGLDILVNNAGIVVYGTAEVLSAAAFDHQLGVNLRGAFLMSKCALPHLRARGGGAIINIASVHSFVSFAGALAYDISKTGLIGLTKTMALDHGREGIRVNAICPGYIRTPLLDTWLNSESDPAAALREVEQFHPLGRIGTPRDIAEAALFLASDAASWITATTLVVDGGYLANGR